MVAMVRIDILRFFAVIVVCAASCGCSVREDRDSCPCRFRLDFSGVDTSLVWSADLCLRGAGGFVFSERIDFEEFCGDEGADGFGGMMEIPVPRGEIDVMVWSGTGGLLSDSGIFIPVGEDCPPVCFHASTVGAYGEEHEERVVMRRNHCVMTVRLTGEVFDEGDGLSDAGADFSFLVVRGNVCGYMADGTPAAGEFRHEMVMRDDGSGSGEGGVVSDVDDDYVAWGTVVLPRQTDESLALEVMGGGDVLRRFNVGGDIVESGYDWSEPDLKDLTVDIEIAVTELRLRIGKWEKVLQFDIII